MEANILKKICYAGIGIIEFTREKLADAGDSLSEFVDEVVARGERLDEEEEGLRGALLAALEINPKIPTANEIEEIMPGYDDLTVTEIIDSLSSLTTKNLKVIREYEFHGANRVRIIKQIDKEIDEVRVIPDYDALAVSAVVEQLDDLSPQQLAALKSYEKSHRNRKTVLKAIDRRLAVAAA